MIESFFFLYFYGDFMFISDLLVTQDEFCYSLHLSSMLMGVFTCGTRSNFWGKSIEKTAVT